MLKDSKRDDSRSQRPAAPTQTVENTTSTNSTGAKQSSSKQATQTISYSAERVIGNGSFGVVYQATVVETRETVAIKKVLQDQRFKNRELQIMTIMNHPNVIALKHCFYSTGDTADQIYLNLVMEYIPETIYRTLRNHTKGKKHVPLAHVRCYMYQICRSIAHIHSLGICHRDIKPQNLLLHPRSHVVKLCDFGSAKRLVESEPNVSYICSRYYRAPELVCDATEYTTAVDVWSLGCVMAELLLGCPIFPGESSTDQLTEIIKTIGSPTAEELHAMNPAYVLKIAPMVGIPWSRIFRDRASSAAVDLISKFLCYTPSKRLDPFDALAHPFFDELRKPNSLLPNGHAPPNIHNWTDAELVLMRERGLASTLVPPHVAADFTQRQLEVVGFAPASAPVSQSSSN